MIGALWLVAWLIPSPALAGPGGRVPDVRLEAVTPTVAPGGTFVVDLSVRPADPAASVRLVVGEPIGSRSAFEAIRNGEQETGVSYRSPQVPLASIERTGGRGTHRLAVEVGSPDGDDAGPGAFPATGNLGEGVYPVILSVAAAGGSSAEEHTFLVVEPADHDPSPPLAVVMALAIDAPLALQPDGTTDLDPSVRGAIEQLTAAMAGTDGDLAVALTGDLVAALDPDLANALAAAAGDSVISRSYFPASAQQLAEVGLDGHLEALDHLAVSQFGATFGTAPMPGVRLADPTLDGEGLELLASLGHETLLVRSELAEVPLDALGRRIQHPIRVEGYPGVVALVADDSLSAALSRQGTRSTAAAVQDIVAELAMVRLDEPSTDRVVTLMGDQASRPDLVAGLVDALGAADRLLVAVTPGEARLSPTSEDPVAIQPTEDPARLAPITAELAAGEALVRALSDMVPVSDPRPADLALRLAASLSADLDVEDRLERIALAVEDVEAILGRIRASGQRTINLTSRTGSLPVRILNDGDVPMTLRVLVGSDRLLFPDGAEIEVVAQPGLTRVDVPVEARTSGSIRAEVEITTPDRSVVLDTQRLEVRSTAISGVGIVLSVGSLAVLLVWWARSLLADRRSRRADRGVA